MSESEELHYYHMHFRTDLHKLNTQNIFCRIDLHLVDRGGVFVFKGEELQRAGVAQRFVKRPQFTIHQRQHRVIHMKLCQIWKKQTTLGEQDLEALLWACGRVSAGNRSKCQLKDFLISPKIKRMYGTCDLFPLCLAILNISLWDMTTYQHIFL